jgi:glycosyltransferase involved in cell wall biosynthesis
MVIIHVAYIDQGVIGGVPIAVPQMIRVQAQYASVALINLQGDPVEGIPMLPFHKTWDASEFPAPFDTPDLIVFHEVYRFPYIGIYKAVKKVNIPYVVVPHGCLSKQAQRKKALKKLVANAIFFKAFLKVAASIQYLSEHEAGTSAFPQFPSFICGNGVAVPETKKTSFFQNGITFVYIGRLEIWIKGLDLLLLAVQSCRDELCREKAKVYLYGPDYDGVHADLQNRIQTLGISDIVSLGNEKMGAEKEAILLSADCFIQASRTEGLPMGTLEALGYGLPCIVTKGVGLGNAIEACGAGYQCDITTEGIADAIRRFLGERDQADRMSKAAARLIETTFDRNRIAYNTVERYSHIAKQ